MSFIGDLFTGEGPKVDTKGVTKSFSTPFYNLKKGNLTAGPDAASPLGFRSIMGGLQENQSAIQGMRSNLNPLRSNVGSIFGNLNNLYGEVRPGFGRVTDARVKAIRDASAESIGDLRTQLGRRAVLGSSFGNDAETRTRLAYAQAEEKARAEATLEEIGVSQQILQQQVATQALALGIEQEDSAILQQSAQNYVAQANTLAQEISSELNQLQVAGNITNQVSGILMEGAMLQARLDMATRTQGMELLGMAVGAAMGKPPSPGGKT